jgi:peptidyl-prolyl cis-trans isomerase C
MTPGQTNLKPRFKEPRFPTLVLFSLLFVFMASCGDGNLTPTATLATATRPAATLTPTALQPSPTSPPLAAQVNGESITLSQYQAELARYQSAAGTELGLEEQERVLNDLIDQILFAQAAGEQGFSVSEESLQARIDDLAGRMGGPQALADWMSANGYTEPTFRDELARSIAAAWMRDQIIAGVPQNAEQVHARQLLYYNADQANEALARLRNGKDFLELAAEVDPLAKGDLDWFPRGYLLDPKLDEAAFSLQPGEYSEIIQTDAGYHILQVIEREPDRPLDPNARLVLQQQALKIWISERRSQSEIEILTH